MTNMQPILNRLITARMNAGLTQGQAAKMLGLSPTASSFQGIESGSPSLTFERFLRLCEIYDVSETWVITGINPTFDPRPLIEAAQRTRMDVAELGDLLELLASLRQEQTP